MLTLYHLAISHCSEKARWALDGKRLAYRSRLLTPGVHVLRSRWMGGRGTVPVLRDSETRATVGDSTDILHYVERLQPHPPLFPDDAERAALVSERVGFFDARCSRQVAGFLYHHVLDHPRVLQEAWALDLPAHRRLLVKVIVRVIGPAMRRTRRIDARSAPKNREQVLEALDQLSVWVGEEGGGYVVGEAFSAADLTAASLLGPAVRPVGSPWDPRRREAPRSPGFPPAEMVAFLREVAGHPGAAWVREMWRRHRPPVAGGT